MDSLIFQFNKLDISNNQDIEDLICTLDNLRIKDDTIPIINYMRQVLTTLLTKVSCSSNSNYTKIWPYIY
jgi:hypothetical protein